MDPMFRFWNRNMDFLIFAITGDIFDVTVCNRHQTWARYLDSTFVLWILDLDAVSGFWNRNIDFLKFAITGKLLCCKLLL